MNRVGLIARKVGMTQLFNDDGVQVPVTVLHVTPCAVVSLITEETRGYNAVLLGTEEETSGKHINKAQLKNFEKLGCKNYRILKEYRVEDPTQYSVGDVFDCSYFAETKFVDVRGKTIGKGFAGGMKRHGFGGLRATHGVSITHRCHGSTGNRTLPGRVFKGKRMAGHMGNTNVTTQNLRIHHVDVEKNVIFVVGSVPGAKNSIVYIRDAVKKMEAK